MSLLLLLLLQPFYGSLDFVRYNPGEPLPEETFTHSTPIVVINHPLSASSIFYDPRNPPCSIYVPNSLFPQSLTTQHRTVLIIFPHNLLTNIICCLLASTPTMESSPHKPFFHDPPTPRKGTTQHIDKDIKNSSLQIVTFLHNKTTTTPI